MEKTCRRCDKLIPEPIKAPDSFDIDASHYFCEMICVQEYADYLSSLDIEAAELSREICSDDE